ncbi:MAG: acyltransferase [Anaerolineales bacterium]|nr:MAG: acyltransferase [Anaerolineales bacterium]
MATQAVAVARARLLRASVEAKPRARTRLAFIDNLRVLLVLLLVVHHAAVTYGPDFGWYYYEGPADIWTTTLLTLFVAVDQAFIMALYFGIAAYFTAASVERKGARRFVADRLLRLGVPLAFQSLVIGPLLAYVLAATVWGYEGTLRDHVVHRLLQDRIIEVGPLWFVEALLLFSLCYLLWWRWSGRSPDDVRGAGPVPSDRALALFAVGIGLVNFAVRLVYPVGRILWPFGFQLAHFPQYIAWFVVGLVAYRRGWLDGLADARGRTWSRVAILLILFAPILFAVGGALERGTGAFYGGLRWQALVYAVLEQLLCMGMIIALLVAFRKRYTGQGGLAKEMSSSAYTVYIIHTPVLVLITLAMRDVTVLPAVKFALASLLTVTCCFLIAGGVRRLPGARRIL